MRPITIARGPGATKGRSPLTTRQAVILAGGLGTRIASLSGGAPKTLLPIAGRPFLVHLLEYLAGQGIRDVVLLLGVGADAVRRAVDAGGPRGLTVIPSIELEPLGTGGALKLAEPHLAKRFWLVNGDTFLRADLAAMGGTHAAAVPAGVVATLALVRYAEAGQKGSVEVDDGGRITRFLEKGRSGPGLINAGVYLMERAALGDIPAGQPVSLEREILPRWLDRGGRPGLSGFVTDAWFVDIGLPEDYLGVKNGFPEDR